jgi:hypothetical protein
MFLKKSAALQEYACMLGPLFIAAVLQQPIVEYVHTIESDTLINSSDVAFANLQDRYLAACAARSHTRSIRPGT